MRLYKVESYGKKSWKFKVVCPHDDDEDDGVISVPVSEVCFCPGDTIGGRRVWRPPPPLLSYVLRNGAKIVPDG